MQEVLRQTDDGKTWNKFAQCHNYAKCDIQSHLEWLTNIGSEACQYWCLFFSAFSVSFFSPNHLFFFPHGQSLSALLACKRQIIIIKKTKTKTKPKQTNKKTSRRTLSFLSMWSDGRLGSKAFVTVKWEAWDENNSKMADESHGCTSRNTRHIFVVLWWTDNSVKDAYTSIWIEPGWWFCGSDN